jgi:hypothetical protein
MRQKIESEILQLLREIKATLAEHGKQLREFSASIKATNRAMKAQLSRLEKAR